jgi:hypothetical protein
MRTISLWEPWASLMRVGAKKIETRCWNTNYRGPLLICASKRLIKSEIIHYLSYNSIRSALQPFAPPWPESGRRSSGVNWQDLHYGKAVAVVDLISCKPTEDVTLKEYWSERFLGDFSPGRFAWFTENLRTIDPFPVVGKQRFFNVDFEIPGQAAQ